MATNDPLKPNLPPKYGTGGAATNKTRMGLNDFLKKNEDELESLRDELSKETDELVKKPLQQQINALEISIGDTLRKIRDENKKEQEAFKKSPAIPGGIFERSRKRDTSTPASDVKKVSNILTPVKKSTSEQLADLQLERLKRQQRQERIPVFQLPDIPKDTATSIVIASLVATFFILAGIGTKFSQLWGYAFNAPIANTGSNQQNQDVSNTGGGQSGDEAWGIPDIYHMIYDTGDAGVTLDEERTA